MLSETDSPFAAPVPNRGKRNEPLYIPHIVAKIAAVKSLSEEEVAKATVENATRVFGVAAH
jgi:TatD DNase family protein